MHAFFVIGSTYSSLNVSKVLPMQKINKTNNLTKNKKVRFINSIVLSELSLLSFVPTKSGYPELFTPSQSDSRILEAPIPCLSVLSLPHSSGSTEPFAVRAV